MLTMKDERVQQKWKNHPDYKVGDPKLVGKANAKLLKNIFVQVEKELKEQKPVEEPKES